MQQNGRQQFGCTAPRGRQWVETQVTALSLIHPGVPLAQLASLPRCLTGSRALLQITERSPNRRVCRTWNEWLALPHSALWLDFCAFLQLQLSTPPHDTDQNSHSIACDAMAGCQEDEVVLLNSLTAADAPTALTAVPAPASSSSPRIDIAPAASDSSESAEETEERAFKRRRVTPDSEAVRTEAQEQCRIVEPVVVIAAAVGRAADEQSSTDTDGGSTDKPLQSHETSSPAVGLEHERIDAVASSPPAAGSTRAQRSPAAGARVRAAAAAAAAA
jgi:hypothetical protein